MTISGKPPLNIDSSCTSLPRPPPFSLFLLSSCYVDANAKTQTMKTRALWWANNEVDKTWILQPSFDSVRTADPLILSPLPWWWVSPLTQIKFHGQLLWTFPCLHSQLPCLSLYFLYSAKLPPKLNSPVFLSCPCTQLNTTGEKHQRILICLTLSQTSSWLLMLLANHIKLSYVLYSCIPNPFTLLHLLLSPQTSVTSSPILTSCWWLSCFTEKFH